MNRVDLVTVVQSVKPASLKSVFCELLVFCSSLLLTGIPSQTIPRVEFPPKRYQESIFFPNDTKGCFKQLTVARTEFRIKNHPCNVP